MSYPPGGYPPPSPYPPPPERSPWSSPPVLVAIVALLLALALTIVPVWSGPAAAHTRLVGTAPAAGAAAPAGTDRVVLSFNQAVSGELAVVEVTGPDGDAASRQYSSSRSCAVIRRPSVITTARRTRLISSRTLPGQSCL